jgi:hypothetical protein
MIPIPLVGVSVASYAGIVSLMTGIQSGGTGGFFQEAGSESPVWAGITIVPSGVITSISACMTATESPHTQPIELMEEWTITDIPSVRPSARKSRDMLSTVRGSGVFWMISCSLINAMRIIPWLYVYPPPGLGFSGIITFEEHNTNRFNINRQWLIRNIQAILKSVKLCLFHVKSKNCLFSRH